MVDNEAKVKVELTLRCTNLPDKDTFSKSDPFAVIWIRINGTIWQEVGRTETIQNNLAPRFKKRFDLDYLFEAQQGH